MSIIQAIYHELIGELEAQKTKTVNEIRSYPPPIPACDSQFNYLLDKRDRLTVEIGQLNRLANQDSNRSNPIDDLLDFVSKSVTIHSEAKQSIRLQLEALYNISMRSDNR